ncbi:MAG: hypothetical protein GX786_01715 [Clostridiales bacterium]|nr:hypothetical protein [Clostridiales bacterium]
MILCDTHADTLTAMAFNTKPKPDITFDSAKTGKVNLQVFALWSGENPTNENIEKRMHAQYQAGQQLLDHGWIQLENIAEITQHSTAFIYSIEGCEIFNDSIDPISSWYEKGVRMAGITWNYENKLGSPAKNGSSQGLTAYGVKAVKEMQQLGIAVDTSHLNEQGFYDIFLKTNLPPLASHSCCNSLCSHFRNLTDEQIRLLISQNGYIGINFYPCFLSESGQASIDTIIDHIAYVCDLGGENHVGFGSDFDGIELYPTDITGPEHFPLLLEKMIQRGFSKESVEKIAGLNFINYYKRIVI